MGGTFDPIHCGHLILAEYSRMSFRLDKILFIPTGRPPHKDKSVISNTNYRYDMANLAINTNPNFYISPIEIQREGTTYTIDTIKFLEDKYKSTEFYFILGADSLYNINKWKDYEKLLKLCRFIVVKRPDVDSEKLKTKVNQLNQIYGNTIDILESPLIDISSTQIRNRVKDGLSIRYLVPEAVRLYIEKNKLYK